VLAEAAAAIREQGPDRVGVAELMAKAGLTHGGFYAHFKSKDDLVAAAIGRMFEESAESFRARTEGCGPAEGLARFIDSYLSMRHREAPGRGCPLPPLSGDVARLDTAARDRFGEGIDGMTRNIAGLLQALGRPDPQNLASSSVAEMVGALALARAISDPARAERLLQASRDALKARLGLDQPAAAASAG
jgi:TetR/AcrR family transcriptional repressor of nem operon